MRVLLYLTLACAAVLSASGLKPICTNEEGELFHTIADVQYLRCGGELVQFEKCDDTCFSKFQYVAKHTPNCSIVAVEVMTRQQVMIMDLKACEKARASTAQKYVPQIVPDLQNCTRMEKDAWIDEFSYNSSYGKCAQTAFTNKTCSDQCVKSIEEGVDATPVCLNRDLYSWREYNKGDLIRCLKARGDDFKANAVLQSERGSKRKRSSSSNSSGSSPSSSPSQSRPSSATAAPSAQSGAVAVAVLPAALVAGSALAVLLALV